MGMDFPDFRRMVAEAMMALRKESDRVHCGFFQRLLPALPVEFLSDPGNMLRGVEVEVDLAESERMPYQAWLIFMVSHCFNPCWVRHVGKSSRNVA